MLQNPLEELYNYIYHNYEELYNYIIFVGEDIIRNVSLQSWEDSRPRPSRLANNSCAPEMAENVFIYR